MIRHKLEVFLHHGGIRLFAPVYLQHAWMARTISDIVADKNSTFTLKQKQMGKSHIFKLGGNFSCPMSGMLHCLIANLDWILQRHSICAIIQIDNQKMQHYMARGSNRQ
ncbi:uncharacterized protein LOC126789085 isoform X2 [Argentina anserina]|uniref:uncharacterized protein LOC126789085 isoform X2 n=1 Tax=Argentina anserina TaxID=57926 RepID=UPI00217656A2|nr:uncharacterized protein LOC126789085 isoform X2 [Potentilla anserina]